MIPGYRRRGPSRGIIHGMILSGFLMGVAGGTEARADPPAPSAVPAQPSPSAPVPAPDQSAPAQAAPAPAQSTSAQSAPVQAAPTQPAPVQPAPAVATGTLPAGSAQEAELGEEARAVRLLAAQIGLRAFTAPDFRPGKVRHIVLMRFLPTITDAQRAEVVRRFRALAQVSRRDNGQQVVAGIETGVQMSGEGADQGFDQAFVMTFNSEGDRNYYVGRPVVTDPAYFDPAHEAFKKFAAPYIIGVLVFDYELPAAQPQHARHASAPRPGLTQQQG
ncbi:Dabb family protein [Novacetimonas pomaceti]|nr:Dabb family protein [Novacetimonas pomaceti]